MKLTNRSVIAAVVSVAFASASPSFAEQGRGGGAPKTQPPKMTGGATHTTAAKGPKTTTMAGGAAKGPKTTTMQGGAAKGPKSTTMAGGAAKGPKSTTMAGGSTKGPKTSTTSPKSGTASANAKNKSTTTAASSTTTTTGGSSPTGTSTTTTLTPVQQKLVQNTNLASKLETRLPKGTDLMTAAEGFRNLGQFVAAVNVSNNLGIDFVNLKTSMVDDGLSLGQAIQKWKPTANATQETSLAESQATTLINTTSTSSTTTTKPKKTKTTGGGE